MKSEKIIKILATGILMAGMMASIGGLAMAEDNSGNGPVVSPNVQWVTGNSSAAVAATGVVFSNNMMVKFNQNIMKEALADLVTAGTITQDQSDAVLTYFQNNAPQKPVIKFTQPADGATGLNGPNPVAKINVVKLNDPLKDLVDKGTITQEQLQAIRDKMRDVADQQVQQQWQRSLDTVADKGTITQDQATQIQDFLEANRQKMESTLDQAKDMDQKQRILYFKENLDNVKDPVSQMVDQGIISQDQADALRQAVPSLPKVVRLQKLSPQQLQANLDALAAKGTITQDQATQIQDFLAANEQKVMSILDQAKSAGPQQVTQDLKQNLATLKDPVSQMLDQGIITQQQADAVREAVAGSGAYGVVTSDGSPGGEVSGGQVFFGFSTSGAAPDDSQN